MRRAIRLFAAQPGFAAIVIAMIAVGVGATTAVFSIVNAVLLRPLPYADSERLVWVWSVDSRRRLQQWVSYPDFLDWRAQSRTVAQFAWPGPKRPHSERRR